jgi:Tfp pilus assembly protein PilV
VERQSIFQNQNGQSLVQVLISMVIMSVLMVSFTSMMTNQTRQLEGLSQKVAATDLQQLMTAALADGSVCSYVLNHPNVMTIDTTRPFPQTITLRNPSSSAAALYASVASPSGPPGPVIAQVQQPASPISNSLIVSSIQLQITGGSNGHYIGNWLVYFDSTKTIVPLKPVSIGTTINVDTTTPPNSPSSARVTSCQNNAPPTSSCPAGFTRIGTAGTAESYCISSTMQTAAPFITAQNNCYNLPTKGHVCTPSEWQLACALGAAGPNNMTGHYEWLASTGYPGDIAIAGPTCDTGGHGLGGMSIGYRCCIR